MTILCSEAGRTWRVKGPYRSLRPALQDKFKQPACRTSSLLGCDAGSLGNLCPVFQVGLEWKKIEFPKSIIYEFGNNKIER